MSIYNFLYQDIRKLQKDDPIYMTPKLRNKFYDAGYINIKEIILSTIDDIVKTTSLPKTEINKIDKQLRSLNLAIGISLEQYNFIIRYYYKDYYNKLLPILSAKQTPYLQSVKAYLNNCFSEKDYKPNYNLRIRKKLTVDERLNYNSWTTNKVTIACHPNNYTYAVSSSDNEITYIVDDLDAALHIVKLIQNPILTGNHKNA